MIKNVSFAARIVCGFFLVFFAVKLAVYHYHFIVYPFPNEYREGAMLTTTAGLVRGVNPYDLQNQPQYMNDYGIFYSIVTWPFAKIFGVTMLVHRLVTAFFIFACCGVMFWIMRRRRADLVFCGLAMVSFYAVCLYPGTTTPMANPSSLGLFIFLLALFIPWARGFSYPSLLISVVLGILAYYTKPYFLLCVPMMALYLFLFVSKRRSIAFSGVFALLALLSIICVHRQWNCYFSNCFFLHSNPGHLSWRQSVNQFNAFVGLNHKVLLYSAIVLAVQALLTPKDWFKVVCFKRPLPFILYCTIICSVVLVFWLGKHEEAFLWYYFHLLSPLLLICMAVTLSRQQPWTLIFMPWLLLSCWSIVQSDMNIKLNPADEGWRSVRDLISTHKDILNSPLIAPLLVQQNKPVYDNGLSEYFKQGGYRDNDLVKIFSKGDPRIIMRYYYFMNEVREKIKRREFDLVLIVQDYAPLVPGELTQFYRPVGKIMLSTPAICASFPLTVWVPNDK
ncbi:MAG: hypothetical protein HQL22_09065 [Candidatus Omnitrophica bacterium]|nr:hypothetical protein [Candidatus Omnitrophota bacterium]